MLLAHKIVVKDTHGLQHLRKIEQKQIEEAEHTWCLSSSKEFSYQVSFHRHNSTFF